ncbi:hypothetical protein ABTE42_20200, partial [Acinetobacter baumannii]
FNGSRFRAEIAPRVMDFMRTHAYRKAKGTEPAQSVKPAAKPGALKMIRGGRTASGAVHSAKKD